MTFFLKCYENKNEQTCFEEIIYNAYDTCRLFSCCSGRRTVEFSVTVTTATSREVASDAVTSSIALKMTAWTAAIRLSSDTRDPTRRSKKSVQSLEDAATAKSAATNQVWSPFRLSPRSGH